MPTYFLPKQLENMKWKTLSSEYLSRYNFFTARKDKCETPHGRIVESYYVVELPLTVCALALTTGMEAVMLRQYRHPIGKIILEVPGGFVEKDELPEHAIERELMEETGYAFTSVEPLGEIAANPGVLNNFTKLYLATGGRKVANQQLDQNEEIDIELVPLNKLEELIFQNKIPQALHATCIFYALLKLKGEIRIPGY